MTGSTEHEVLTALLHEDLGAFTAAAFDAVTGERYLHNWHIEAITHELDRCLAGDTRRLLVTQPPRSLKSICSSVALPAFALGHDPGLEIICVSYSQDLANALHRQFRRVIESDWYAEVFPRMRAKRITDSEFSTTRGGGRLATSIGGTLTGRGGDIIIIDDPLKADDGLSAAARQHLATWYRETLLSRLNDKENGIIILVQQRLHEDDLAGHVLRDGGWRHLDLPAIALEPQAVRTGPRPDDIHQRKIGEALHPARESLATLEKLKAELGSLVFSAQYQQRPVPAEGNLVKREWLRRYDEPPGKGRLVQSWDVAGALGEDRDYSACTTWRIVGKDYYLLDAWRDRLEFPALRRAVIDRQQRLGAQVVLIEKAGLGLNLVQDLRDEPTPGFPRPIGLTPDGDKEMRMAGPVARFEAGQVHLPKEAAWLDAYLGELLGFPNTRHDDLVDSTSQLLNWVSRRTEDPPAIVPPEAVFSNDSDPYASW